MKNKKKIKKTEKKNKTGGWLSKKVGEKGEGQSGNFQSLTGGGAFLIHHNKNKT